MARLGHVTGVLLSTGAALFVAGTAFALAYGGSKGAAIDAGMSSPGWFPWCIEGVIVVSSLSVVALPRGERTLAWVVLLASTAVSVVANVLHALDHPGHEWWSPYFAAVPPLTLPLCMQLAERVALSLRPTRDTPTLDIPVGHPTGVGQVSTLGTPTPDPVGALEDLLYMPEIPEQPDGAVALVYRLFDDEGALLYIGCTVHPRKRFHSHRRRQPWWDEVTDSELMWYPSVEVAALAEQQAIRTEQPIYNIGLARYLGPVAGQGPESEPTQDDATQGVDDTSSDDVPHEEDGPAGTKADRARILMAAGLSRSRAYALADDLPRVAQARARVNGHKP